MEIFKDIPDYEGLYQVSNKGRVLSLAKNDGNGNRDRYLKFDIRGQYYSVTLSKLGIVKRFPVHKLVTQCFIPNPENKKQVNHIDLNKLNNCVENLEWVTPSENAIHAYKNEPKVRQAILKGANTLKTNARTNNEKRGKELLGSNFIEVYSVPTSDPTKFRWYIKGLCLNCNKEVNIRNDNLTSSQGMCRKCQRNLITR